MLEYKDCSARCCVLNFSLQSYGHFFIVKSHKEELTPYFPYGLGPFSSPKSKNLLVHTTVSFTFGFLENSLFAECDYLYTKCGICIYKRKER